MANRLSTLLRLFRRMSIVLLVPFSGGCAGLLFYPTEQHILDPAEYGIQYEDVYFAASDGTTLHGWLLPAAEAARGTIVFAHGNAQNISTHINSVYWLPNAGYNVFLFDYRGFGRSQGQPDLSGAHEDALAALELARCIDDPSHIVVLGQSIGGSIFTVAVSELEWASALGGMVVDSAPTSYRVVARERLADWWLTWAFQVPLSWLIPDSYRAIDAAQRLPEIPKVFIGNAGDETIEIHHADRLYQYATPPKEQWRLDLTGHVPTFLAPDNRRRFTDWLDTTLPNKPSSRLPVPDNKCGFRNAGAVSATPDPPG